MLSICRLVRINRGYLSALILIWLTLGAFGVTASSLALNFSTIEDNSANVIWANPQSIRSDEWIRTTPADLAEFQPNWNKKNLTPIEAGNLEDQTSAASYIEKIVFFMGISRNSRNIGKGTTHEQSVRWLPFIIY